MSLFSAIPSGMMGLGRPGFMGGKGSRVPPQQKIDGIFGNNRPREPITEGSGIMGGIRGFLDGARGEGNFADRLGMFGATLQDIEDGGDRAGGIREQQQADTLAEQARAQRAELDALAQGLGMDNRERLLFLADPEAWARANASRYEAYTLGQGGSRYQGAERQAYNPDVGVDGGFGYAIGEDGQVEWGEGRPVSAVEQARIDDYAAREADRQARLGLSQDANARAAAAAARAAARAGRGGGGGSGSSGSGSSDSTPRPSTRRPWER